MQLPSYAFRATLLLALAASLAACGSDGTPTGVKPDTTKKVTADTTPLRYYAQLKGRYIGTAAGSMLSMPGDSGVKLRSIAAREFSMLWTGTYMKMDYLRPNRATYNYTTADNLLTWAQQNGMVMRGHTLVWHSQVPSWITNGGFAPDTLKAILKDHIEQVMTHYKGKLAAWDVVNEAMGDDANIRPTIWYNAIGPDYIEQAFRWARAVDPNTPLYYNDYNIESINAKSTAVYNMLSDLKARGVPIDGIGFQFHFDAASAPSTAAITANFQRFAALGLKIQITEADMHTRVIGGIASMADQLVQATAYANMVNACLSVSACNAIEIEGTYDGQAWVNDPANWGAPVLYDIRMQPKPAYYAVRTALAAP